MWLSNTKRFFKLGAANYGKPIAAHPTRSYTQTNIDNMLTEPLSNDLAWHTALCANDKAIMAVLQSERSISYKGLEAQERA